MYELLSGVRVVELCHVLLGPLAAQFLGDLGADVIKVEAPDGDIYRGVGVGRSDGMSAQWMGCNRNKRSIALDLKTPQGRAILLDLVRGADIFLHNMRPQAIERLGIGPQAALAINPSLIYGFSAGFGQSGPAAAEPAFDDIIQARGGVAGLSAARDGEPALVPAALTDLTTAMMLAQSVLAALVRRQRGGAGAVIEVPMLETTVSLVLNQHLNGRSFEPPQGDIGYPRMLSPSRRPVRCADGHLVHGIYTLAHWRRFLPEVGRRDLLEDEMLRSPDSLSRNISQLYRIVAEEIMPARDVAGWIALLRRLDIPCARVASLDDLAEDEHLAAVGMFEPYTHETEGPMRQVRSPVVIANESRRADRPPPVLDRDGDEILAALGMSADAIEALRASGAVGPRPAGAAPQGAVA